MQDVDRPQPASAFGPAALMEAGTRAASPTLGSRAFDALHRGFIGGEAKEQHVGGYGGFRAIRKRSTPQLGKPVCRFVMWLADAACYRTVEWAAFSIRLATAAGWETGTAWDAWISIVCECARLAMNFCAAAGMFLS